jgi:hypothetical protein
MPDVLFQVDPVTGRHVADAFGPGRDYLALQLLPAYPDLWDVDDLAIEPATGQMYAILNNSWNGDRLVRVDRHTGEIADIGAFGVAEVEGLSFDPHGRLWATAGGWATNEADKLYEVDLVTGRARHPRRLAPGGNYEGLACLTAAPDLRLQLVAAGLPRPGAVVTYTLRYANLGNQHVPAVLTQTVPAGAAFYPAGSAPGWTQVASASVYTYPLAAVSPGASGALTFAVRLDPRLRGPVANTARIAPAVGTALDLNPADNAAVLTLPVGYARAPVSPILASFSLHR